MLVLVLFLLRSKDRLATGEAGEGAANGRPGLLAYDSGASPEASARPTKTSRPRAEKKPAPDAEQEKFKRVFLPPIKLENATLDEAIAAVIAAYEEAARLTGETAQPLDIDRSAAIASSRVAFSNLMGGRKKRLNFSCSASGAGFFSARGRLVLVGLADASGEAPES